ncbi:MAG: hypothetical protein NTV36_00090, partial [Candidatus Staskawiczbacteria bacterium]|nr:hypothetical protein [Candidatus Staskawiczbacteria bacterium]
MIQNTFHNQNNDTIKPPPNQFNLTLIQRLASIYKLWHEFLLHFPKDTKYTLGNKIDSLVLEVLEFTIKAS